MTDPKVNGDSSSQPGHDDPSWNNMKVAVYSRVNDPSLKERIQFWTSITDFIKKNGIPHDDIPFIFHLFTVTVPIYTDRVSRGLIEKTLQVFVSSEDYRHAFVKSFANDINNVSLRIGLAPSEYATYLQWVNTVLEQLGVDETFGDASLSLALRKLIGAQANLIDRCLSTAHRKQRLATSVLQSTTKTLETLVTRDEDSYQVVDLYVDCLAVENGDTANVVTNAVLLGVLANATCYLTRDLRARETLDYRKKDIISFFLKQVLGSRTPLPPHTCSAFNLFWSEFLNKDDFESLVLPSLDKAILRSPEVVLNGIIPELIVSLAPSIDLSEPLEKKLLTPLLGAVRSSKDIVRQSAGHTLEVIVRKSKDQAPLTRVAIEMATQLKTNKVSAVDQKMLYLQVLRAIPRSESIVKSLVPLLAPLAIKESSETVLAFYAGLLFDLVFSGLSHGQTFEDSVVDSFIHGLLDKRHHLRKQWILSFGDHLYSMTDPGSEHVKKFVHTLLGPVLRTYQEVVDNSTSALQNKVISAGYVPIALRYVLTSWNVPEISDSISAIIDTDKLFSNEPKPSILLSPRVYSKLSTFQEQEWALRALKAVLENIKVTQHKQAVIDWASAWIFFATKGNGHEIRNLATNLLNSVFYIDPLLTANAVIDALWEFIYKFEPADVAIIPRIRSVIRAINPNLFYAVEGDAPIPFDPKILSDILIKLALLANHEDVSSDSWIDACLRVGIDPGKLVQERYAELIDIIATASVPSPNDALPSGLSDKSEKLLKASMNLASVLNFIAPNIISPLLIGRFVRQDLDPSGLGSITLQDASIWKTDPSIAFVDVLSKDKTIQLDKNSKDYETKRWEAQLRAELEAKKRSASSPSIRKLTKEQHIKVKEQLAKESKIRANVQAIFLRVYRSITLIDFLISSNVADVSSESLWFPACVRHLAKICKAGASIFVGQYGFDVFVGLSAKTSHRLGGLRPTVGAAILRELGIPGLPTSHTAEPLIDQVTRILFRLQFLSQQSPLDPITFDYCLILLLQVLQTNLANKHPEEVDEQVSQALTIISEHAGLFVQASPERSTLLDSLLGIVRNSPTHIKQARDCLMTVLRIAADSLTDHDLKLLLSASVSTNGNARRTALEAIDEHLDISHLSDSAEIWVSAHDARNPDLSEIAISIWQENGLKLTKTIAFDIFTFFESPSAAIREASAKAVYDAIRIQTEQGSQGLLDDVYKRLVNVYLEAAEPPEPVKDQYGNIRKDPSDLKDPWEYRSGCALTFKELAPLWNKDDHLFLEFIMFLINKGPLGDNNSTVRQEMQAAAVSAIHQHGASHVEQLMPILSESLDAPDTGSSVEDRVRESTIVMYGALGQHLAPTDDRLPKIIDRLLLTLNTPSEDVQFAVANCLPALIRLVPEKSGDYIEKLVEEMFHASKYAERRGAAYGLAGIVKGYGIKALSEFDILRALTGAIEDKKDPDGRQGAAFAIECLSQVLGRFFEPFIIYVLPLLLTSLGDTSPDVRQAAADASKVVMQNTSGYGVKLLIPIVLESLDETAWRAKKGAVEILGAMAYLDPQQLSNSLSTIIPEIVSAMNDSHKDVRQAANSSLQKFGEVISNPEIQGLVPILLKAIGDPSKYSDDAMTALLKTSFAHYIDAPSLALVIHILNRGLKDRSAGTKRKAAQIVGNMAMLTDRHDLIPYLNSLVSELEIAMVDPVPSTRATASRALGSLVEKLGEEEFPGLIDRLFEMICSDINSGDRVGAAQGLAEVIGGLGTAKLDELLPSILKTSSSPKNGVREGFMSLMIFLPATFGASFGPYLGKVIPPILSGLADNSEPVRDTALRAGRLLVKSYATRAVDLLLPELERGLMDDNHRIRLSSVELTGDLLFQITGVSAKIDAEAEALVEEGEASGKIASALLEALGTDRRDRVLALLYICRSDTYATVRNSSVAVWKSLVANTPRTVKDILPTITNILIRKLSSSNEEQRTIGAHTLGDIVRRVGDSAISQLLPTLETGMRSGDESTREGICVALNELISSVNGASLENHQGAVIDIIRSGLSQRDPAVREAAAQTFDTLHQLIGREAIDEVLPFLLNLLQSEDDSENALAALKEIMSVRASAIFPVLIPTLTSQPITAFHARALGSLAEVAGNALSRRVSSIINSLITSALTEKDPAVKEEIGKSINKVLLSVVDDNDAHAFIQYLLELVKDPDGRKRQLVWTHLKVFFSETTLDYSMYYQDWISDGLLALADPEPEVIKNAWSALSALTSKLSKEDMERLVISTRKSLAATGVAGQDLPGFCIPKGPSCILPIFLQGLMYGTNDQRENAALGIADIVLRTPPDQLRPFYTQMTGPLIRIGGERYPSAVKAAILYALDTILTKIPAFLKPFFPQLQRTFVKSLSDPTNEVLRNRAAKALGNLIVIQPRVDPLVNELSQAINSGNLDIGVKVAMLKALEEVVTKASKNMSENSRNSVLSVAEAGMDEEVGGSEAVKNAAAKLLGCLLKELNPEDSARLLRERILNNLGPSSVLAMNAIMRDSASVVANPGILQSVFEYIQAGLRSESALISDNCTVLAGKFLLSRDLNVSFEMQKEILTDLANDAVHPASGSPDTRRLALVVIRTIARQDHDMVKPHFNILIPAAFAGVRDPIIPIKLAAEKAYLALLQMVDKGDSLFEKWIAQAENPDSHVKFFPTSTGVVPVLRSVQDYTKRVAMRLASAERERIAAGGDYNQVFSDQVEDEQEVWAVGGVDLSGNKEED